MCRFDGGVFMSIVAEGERMREDEFARQIYNGFLACLRSGCIVEEFPHVSQFFCNIAGSEFTLRRSRSDGAQFVTYRYLWDKLTHEIQATVVHDIWIANKRMTLHRGLALQLVIPRQLVIDEYSQVISLHFGYLPHLEVWKFFPDDNQDLEKFEDILRETAVIAGQ